MKQEIPDHKTNTQAVQLSSCVILLFQSIFPHPEVHSLVNNKNEVYDAISFFCA